jgi:hypothetical protein
MAQPFIAQEPSLRHFAQSLCAVFSLPQWQYFVTVLLGLLHCDERRTLTGLLRQVAVRVSLSGLSRFLKRAPWSVEDLTAARQARFQARLTSLVAQAQAQARAQRPRRPGRPRPTVVTGFLILDDSTHVKRDAQAMEGQGWHYSSSDKRAMPGHSLFAGVYLLLGQQFPLTPQLYRQQAVCAQEGVPFHSKVDLALQAIQTFQPQPDTHTHVLTDAWYTNGRTWRAARQRGGDFTGGLKANRQLRRVEPDGQRRWQSLAEYAAGLRTADFQAVVWPTQAGGKTVSAPLVRTRVKKLGACQVLIVKPNADAPVSAARFWATSRVQDTLAQVVAVVAQRWTVETLFADFKERMGSDQYQVRSAQAIVRFWALGLCLYQYLDEVRTALQQERSGHVTLGEVRGWVREQHAARLTDWIVAQVCLGARAAEVHHALQPAVA